MLCKKRCCRRCGVGRLAPEESSWRPEGVVPYKEVRVKKVADRRNARFLPAKMLVCMLLPAASGRLPVIFLIGKNARKKPQKSSFC